MLNHTYTQQIHADTQHTYAHIETEMDWWEGEGESKSLLRSLMDFYTPYKKTQNTKQREIHECN